MKVLTATAETQGSFDTDFFWTIDGELVMRGLVCGRDLEDDGPCGCRRSLVGIDSSKATTTFAVSDMQDIRTVEDLAAIIFAARSKHANVRQVSDANQLAADIANAAARFEVGTVLEMRNGKVQPRLTPDLAFRTAQDLLGRED